MTGGRGRERERPEEGTREDTREGSFVRSFALRRLRKTGRRKKRESTVSLSLSPSISIRPRSMGYAIERRSKIDPRADEGRDLAVRRRRVRSDPRA